MDRLQTPNEAFFHQNPKLLGLGRYILWYFGYFLPIHQHPVWYIISTKNKASITKSQIFIWDWDLNLGRKELGI
jgi:hypothetical protein